MRIGIDAAAWANRRGYGRFLRETIGGLARIDSHNSYRLFIDHQPTLDAPLPTNFSFRVVPSSRPAAQAAAADGRRSALDLLRMARAVAAESLDVFFFPAIYSYFPLLRRVPMLLGIHDTMAVENPSLAFAARLNHNLWRIKAKLARMQADAYLTVSQFSKRSIERFYRIPPARIHVVHEAASAAFYPSPNPLQREDFILYAGGISPHKNLHTLIQAFASSRAKSAQTRLLLVGDQQDAFLGCRAELQALVSDLRLNERVEFPGFLPDPQLADLCRRTRLFVAPSLVEGFGLPAVEAMACGAPLIISRGHALDEVAADAALTFDARDVDELQLRIDQALADDALCRRLSAASLRQAATFSWDQTARGVFSALSSVAGNPVTAD